MRELALDISPGPEIPARRSGLRTIDLSPRPSVAMVSESVVPSTSDQGLAGR